jgi:hypothetical protein
MTDEEKYISFIEATGFKVMPVDYMKDDGMNSYNFIPEYNHTFIVFYADTGKFCMTVSDGELEKWVEDDYRN